MPAIRPKLTSPLPPSSPLLNARHEAFAFAVANGAKLVDAHLTAGFTTRDRAAAATLRWKPDVAARIDWILKQRVSASAKSFARRSQAKGELSQRIMKELEAIAFQDVGEVASWSKRPVVNDLGEIVRVEQAFDIRDSQSMPAEARRAIKAATLRSGVMRLEMHDKLGALEKLAKACGLLGGDAPAPVNVTQVNMNVGHMDAIEAARRVSFLLAAAAQPQAIRAPVTIDASAVQQSKDMAGDDDNSNH